MSGATALRPADNPFRVERVDAIDFLPQGTTWPTLIERLARLRFRAAVVGPHGSGKTTLLASLSRRLTARGLRPRPLFRQSGGGGAMPGDWRPTLARVGSGDILIVDGYGHLSAWSRWRLRRIARHGAGLIVTSHARCGLPILLHTATSPALLREVVAGLTPRPLPPEDAAILFAHHRGNLRDALRELYDRAADGPGEDHLVGR